VKSERVSFVDEAVATSLTLNAKSSTAKETKFDVYMHRSSRALFNEKNKDKGERMKKLVVDKISPSMQSY